MNLVTGGLGLVALVTGGLGLGIGVQPPVYPVPQPAVVEAGGGGSPFLVDPLEGEERRRAAQIEDDFARLPTSERIAWADFFAVHAKEWARTHDGKDRGTIFTAGGGVDAGKEQADWTPGDFATAGASDAGKVAESWNEPDPDTFKTSGGVDLGKIHEKW